MLQRAVQRAVQRAAMPADAAEWRGAAQDLFGASAEGGLYAITDLYRQGRLYTDAALETVLTDAADPLGGSDDLSGNGSALTQSTSTARPIIRQAADGTWYAEFDLTDDVLSASPMPAMSPSDTAQIVYATTQTILVDDFVTGGGLDIGPTAWTGRGNNLFDELGGDFVGLAVRDKRLSAAERQRTVDYFKNQGAGDEWPTNYPQDVILTTANGEPCHMIRVPKFNVEDVVPGGEMGTGTHPAFIVGGVEKNAIYVGKYQASVVNGEALSQPGVVPTVNTNWDESVAACTANGPGWHLMTNWEWAAIALWCMANGFEPRGNTNWGRHHSEQTEQGVRGDGGTAGSTDGDGKTLTGSGPNAWRHDNSPAGIADLVGNVWEWMHGLKLEAGEIFMPADNDYTLADTAWPTTGKFVRGDINAGDITLAESGSAAESTVNTVWASTLTDAGYTSSEALRRALIEPSAITPVGRFYARDYGVRFPLRGGNWYNGGIAGLAALNLYGARTYSTWALGFRPAFAL